MKDAKKVATKKKNEPKMSRNKLTTYIATTLKSRQEFEPPVGAYIDFAKAEPLHLKNNVIKEQFMKLFKICIGKTNLKGVKKF